MRAICASVLCLLMCGGCSLLPQRQPMTVEVPVAQPLQCLDTAMAQCEGVPRQDYATAHDLAVGLGHALRALADCQDRHNELRGCVSAHNGKEENHD